MNAMEHNHSGSSAEAVILDELKSAPLAAAQLKERVLKKLNGLKATQFKAYLDALVAAQRVHGVHELGAKGKPKKTIATYVFGAPPPPPPPKPAPRELAPNEILKLLGAGTLSANLLKERVKANLPGLALKDYTSVLAALTSAHEIYGRRKLNKDGKPSKTVESYSLGGPPPDEFIAPVLAKWKEARGEAAAVGVSEQALVAALLAGLSREGVNIRRADSVEPSGDDRTNVLRGVQALVAREGHGALIPIRKLRAALQLPKSRLDEAVLQLYADDALILHHHDYVGNLSEAERDELVLDRHGNYYVGVALRGEQ